MDQNTSKSIKNLIYSALGQVITIAVGLLLPRLVITSYGSETNGLLNSVNQFIVYLSLFEAGLGTVTLQALYGPLAHNDRQAINGVLSATHFYYKRTGYAYLATLTVLSLVYPLAARSELPYFAVAGIVFFSGIGNVIMFFLQGKYKLLLQADGRNYITTNLTTLTTVLHGVTKAVLILCGFNVLHVLIASALINLIQVAYLLLYVRKHYPWIDLKEKPAFEAISEKNYMLIHQVAILILYNTDVLLLTVFCDLRVVSVYSIYKLVLTQLENVLSIAVGSINFLLGQLFHKDREKFQIGMDAFETGYSVLAFTIYTVAQVLLVPFVALYTDGVTDINYQDHLLAFLFSINAIFTAVRVPMLNTISYAGHFKSTTPQTVAEAVINLTVSLLCVGKFGIHGVLFGTLVALVYRTCDVIIYANTKVLGRKPWGSFATHLVNFAVYALLSLTLPGMIGPIRSYVAFALWGLAAVPVCLICFGAAQGILFPARIRSAWQMIRKKAAIKIHPPHDIDGEEEKEWK